MISEQTKSLHNIRNIARKYDGLIFIAECVGFVAFLISISAVLMMVAAMMGLIQ